MLKKAKRVENPYTRTSEQNGSVHYSSRAHFLGLALTNSGTEEVKEINWLGGSL